MINVVITSGGTSEPIDRVRKITNSSTGRLGANIANKLIQREDIGKNPINTNADLERKAHPKRNQRHGI